MTCKGSQWYADLRMALPQVLPPRVVLILTVLAGCLTLVGDSFGLPVLSTLGKITAVAGLVGFGVFMVILLADEPVGPHEADARLATYLRAFFTDILTGMKRTAQCTVCSNRTVGTESQPEDSLGRSSSTLRSVWLLSRLAQ